MNIEKMLYIYLFVCLAMIVFNVVTAVVLHRKDKRTVKISEGFRDEIASQIRNLKETGAVTSEHKDYLISKLRRVGNMKAFDKVLEEFYEEDPDETECYLSELSHVIVYLTEMYAKKGSIEAAYFPYIIKKYGFIKNKKLPVVIDEMYALLKEPSIYCRENAMQALYTTGDCGCVTEAIKIIDGSGLFFHEKLLADGLLNFDGDHEKLICELINIFDGFTVEMRVALLNFFRFDSPNHGLFALGLLRDETQDDEIRYACIRYLGKYHYDDAYEYLLTLARNGKKWQYRAIASSALAIYPGEETEAVLKNNLHSREWYIRYNSSESLERLGITYIDLIDIMEGNDRYASEILRYRFDAKKLSESEEAKV